MIIEQNDLLKNTYYYLTNFINTKLNMNVKRIFGALLTLLGVASLIYTALLFANTSGSTRDIKSLIIYGVLGILFFMSGISLVRTTKDES